MKVKDLKDTLDRFDPESEVLVPFYDLGYSKILFVCEQPLEYRLSKETVWWDKCLSEKDDDSPQIVLKKFITLCNK